MRTATTFAASSKTRWRPRSADRRAVMKAIFYLVVAGCAWRMLPHDFPNWKTVYHYFRVWRLNGTGQPIHAQFVSLEQVAQGHSALPSAASMDSQSVKTATSAAITVGFDGGKRVKGRKRHLMVETLGWVMMVVVTGAYLSDQQGARLVFQRLAAILGRLYGWC